MCKDRLWSLSTVSRTAEYKRMSSNMCMYVYGYVYVCMCVCAYVCMYMYYVYVYLKQHIAATS